jgi:hypothetical protein
MKGQGLARSQRDPSWCTTPKHANSQIRQRIIVDKRRPAWLLGGKPSGELMHAGKKPIRDSFVGRANTGTESWGGQIDVALLQGATGQDDSHGGAWDEQR